jgi:metallo-beta-lactamase family protein
LPLLVKRGFQGRIFTNQACADLLPILLNDSADLLMREAERANRRLDRHQQRVTPLFDLRDVERTLGRLHRIPYDKPVEVFAGVSVCARDAGHIMGSSSLELTLHEDGLRRRLVFSGDLGQYDTPILKDPWRFEAADLVLMESTYGDRLHRGRDDTARELGAILAQAARDGGNVLVPAFAIGRSQELLYLLAKHYAPWRVDRWGIFLDSPMAVAACTGNTMTATTRKPRGCASASAGCRRCPTSPCRRPPSNPAPSTAYVPAPSSSPAAAWRTAGASCITCGTISNGRSATWS